MKFTQMMETQLKDLQKKADAVADELDHAYDVYYAMEVDASYSVDECEHQDSICVALRDQYEALAEAVKQTQNVLNSLEAYSTYQNFHEEFNLAEV